MVTSYIKTPDPSETGFGDRLATANKIENPDGPMRASIERVFRIDPQLIKNQQSKRVMLGEKCKR